MPPLPEGWVWNGYYLRELISSALAFFGKVAIRVAYDKNNKIHHAFFPAFIIPSLKVTTFDLETLLSAYIENSSVSVSGYLETYTSELPEYFDLPVSTFYFLLSWVCKKLRSNHGISPPEQYPGRTSPHPKLSASEKTFEQSSRYWPPLVVLFSSELFDANGVGSF